MRNERATSESFSARLVRSHLDGEGLRDREARAVRLFSWLTTGAAVLGVAFAPLLGSAQTLLLVGALGALSLLERRLATRIEGGFFRPWLPWVNSAVEASTPGILLVLDEIFHGPELALTREGLVVYAAAVLLSALRLRRRLSLFAGALAATEYLAFYFAVCLPSLPAVHLATLEPGFALVRAALLLASGGLAALLASQLVSVAQGAVRHVREQDFAGKYIIHERLGAGGMAEVFRATYSPEGGFEKPVAIKRILASYAGDPEFLDLFRREARLGSMLSHPNVVQILDVGRQGPSLFMAMELVDGLSLLEAMRVLLRPLPMAAVAYVGAELADALDYIHRRAGPSGEPLHLVHRDVNPANILASRYGEVKLADFGIARAARGSHLTRPGVLRGKLSYLAPEQLEGDSLDGRSDLFSLGLTLRETLTGRRLFHGSEAEILAAIVDSAPLPNASLDLAGVPGELDQAIAGLLRRDPEARTASGQELRAALCLVPPPAAPYPNGKEELAAFVRQALERKAGSASAPPDDPNRTRRVVDPLAEARAVALGEPAPRPRRLAN